MLALGLGITAALQLLLTYLPVMNTLFHTAPVGVDSWLRVGLAAAVAFVVVEADKLIWSSLASRIRASRGV